VTRIEQSLLAVHTAALTVVAVIHLTYSPKLVLAFIGAHNRYIRDYWSIVDHAKNDADSGIWPGLLSAVWGDLGWIVLVLTPIALPLLLLKHSLTRAPGTSFFTVLRRFVVGNLVAVLFAFTAGGLLGALFIGVSLVVLPLAGRPFSAEFGTIIELVASGVIFTDLVFAVSVWWIDLDEAPGTEWALGLGAAAGLVLAVAGSRATKVETQIVAPTQGAPLLIYSYHSRQDQVREADSSLGAIHRFASVYTRSTFVGEELTAPLEQVGDLTLTFQHIFGYSTTTPFLNELPAFYHQRPRWLTWERGNVSVGYELTPFANSLPVATRQLTLTKEEAELVFAADGIVGWVRVERGDSGQEFGLVLRRTGDSDIELLFRTAADGVKLTTKTDPPQLIAQQGHAGLARGLALKSEQRGISFWVDGNPIWLLSDAEIERVGGLSLGADFPAKALVQRGK
jgi:hypothetical protein